MTTSFRRVPPARWYLAAAAGLVVLVLALFVIAARRPTLVVRVPRGVAHSGASLRANGRDHPLECRGATCSLYESFSGTICSVTLRESNGGVLSFECDYCMQGDELELSVAAGRTHCTHAYDR